MSTIEALLTLALALYCAKTATDLWSHIGSRAFQTWRRRRDDRNRRAVWLNNHGHRKIAVIKVIRENTGLSLRKAKDASEGKPSGLLANGLSADRAKAFAEELSAAGASITVGEVESVAPGIEPCATAVTP